MRREDPETSDLESPRTDRRGATPGGVDVDVADKCRRQPGPPQSAGALPGWFVKRTGRRDVWVYSGKELSSLPKARGAQPLTPQDMQRVAHQVERWGRTVAPKMAEVANVI